MKTREKSFNILVNCIEKNPCLLQTTVVVIKTGGDVELDCEIKGKGTIVFFGRFAFKALIADSSVLL